MSCKTDYEREMDLANERTHRAESEVRALRTNNYELRAQSERWRPVIDAAKIWLIKFEVASAFDDPDAMQALDRLAAATELLRRQEFRST